MDCIGLYGIAYGCPYGERDRDKECPLYEIKDLPFSKKIKFIDSLSESKKLSVTNFHIDCLRSKEKLKIDTEYKI